MLDFITSKLHDPIGSDALLISVYFIVMSSCTWPGPFYAGATFFGGSKKYN